MTTPDRSSLSTRAILSLLVALPVAVVLVGGGPLYPVATLGAAAAAFPAVTAAERRLREAGYDLRRAENLLVEGGFAVSLLLVGVVAGLVLFGLAVPAGSAGHPLFVPTLLVGVLGTAAVGYGLHFGLRARART